MDAIDFRFDDAGRFAAKMTAAPNVVKEEMITGVNRLTTQGQRYSQEAIYDNGSFVTGGLSRSITTKKASFAGSEVRGSWGTSKDYAKAVEEGRRGFGPVSKKALAFKPRLSGPVAPGKGINIRKRAIFNADGTFASDQKISGGGKYTGLVVVKRVGPAKAKPFIKPARKRIEPDLQREFRAVTQRIIKRLGMS